MSFQEPTLNIGKIEYLPLSDVFEHILKVYFSLADWDRPLRSFLGHCVTRPNLEVLCFNSSPP
jgi:hypothetical protein